MGFKEVIGGYMFRSLSLLVVSSIIVFVTGFLHRFSHSSTTFKYKVSGLYDVLVYPLLALSVIMLLAIILLGNNWLKFKWTCFSIQMGVLIIVSWLFINGFFRV
jgi:cobalamin synthase